MDNELRQQWSALQAAEREWLDNPTTVTALAYTDAFKRVRIGAIGELLAEVDRLQAVVEAGKFKGQR